MSVSNFINLQNHLTNHCEKLFKNAEILFEVDIDKDELWELYLNSFPPGTNEVYRERREYDCSCCKQFVRNFGNVVVINPNTFNFRSIWDFEIDNDTYQIVLDELSKYIYNNTKIKDFFITKESKFGVKKNYEKKEDNNIITWHHFFIELPKKFINKSSRSIGDIKGELRENKNVFKRSMEEVSLEAIDTIIELIDQNSLYKGEEWKSVLEKYRTIHIQYNNTPCYKDNFCWLTSHQVGPVISKIKNHSIGVLLSDITNGMDLNEAVKRYEKIVAPTNYKRPKAIFTKRMIEDAKNKLDEMGLLESLERRHATIEDITVNNILFANKDAHKKMGSDIFDELEKDIIVNPKKFNKIEEVNIKDFVNNILPSSKTIELLFENKHKSNLVSVIAPQNKNSKLLFKWNNNFSWAYNGNITDSLMKERVKSAGGKVDGVLRFSIQWNENHDNKNDYDAHCIEPGGNLIYFGDMRNYDTKGNLDVDIRYPDEIAVENITWPDIQFMRNGRYKFMVHNFEHRGGRSGFSAEIEFDGQIYSFEYRKDIKYKETVLVAEIEFNKDKGIKFIKSLDSQMSSKTIWELKTNQFYPVSVCMYSPNYWDDQKGIGHRHYFFIINDCKNEERPNGFFNEFLHEELMKQRKFFEALGSKMKVENSKNQLSGIGFSSTKRNSVICKVTGSFTRTLKIKF
jgi:hypothetical protein